MIIDLWLFIPACFAINLAFGPNNLMAMTNAAKSGVRFATTAACGRFLAFLPMILISALGLGVLMSASAWAFTAAKVIGAAYLIYLGIKLLRADVPETEMTTEGTGLKIAFRRETLVAFSNPKAILTFAAFFPQFVNPESYWASYALEGAIFLVLEFVAILAYALVGRVAASGAGQYLTHVQKLSGGTMIVFGLGLLWARKPGSV
ncbi:MAG: LysE family translocator [Marinovum sp.]|nr:LysE family translocator [Marinovum sp.]